MQLRRAQKSVSKLRIGLAGPSGAGKTYSALLLASGFTKWSNICVIDTERQSADLYSDLGPYNVITLEAPFEPQKYIDAIKLCESEGMEVIIVDSITHEWSACKDMVDKLGGRFQDWAKVTPIHDRFIDAIVSSKCHVITTVRSKSDYAMTTEGGKTRVQKVGLKQETRDGFEYELTCSLDLNVNHLAQASKDRTSLFMDADPFVVTKETGKTLLNWANAGDDPIKLSKELKKLYDIKGKNMQSTLDHFGVDNLADISYPNLIAIKDKLNAVPDAQPNAPQEAQAKEPEPAEPQDEEPPQSPEPAQTEEIPAESPQQQEGTGMSGPWSAPATVDARNRFREMGATLTYDENKSWMLDGEVLGAWPNVTKRLEQMEAIQPEESDEQEVQPSTSGQRKLLEACLTRRAKQAKKGYDALLGVYLKRFEVDKVEDLSHAQVEELIDEITKKNQESK